MIPSEERSVDLATCIKEPSPLISFQYPTKSPDSTTSERQIPEISFGQANPTTTLPLKE